MMLALWHCCTYFISFSLCLMYMWFPMSLAHARTHTHADTHKHFTFLCKHKHTHVHTQLVLVLILPGTWYTVLAVVHSPHACKPSGGSNAGGPIGSSGASLSLVLIFSTARPGYVATIWRVSQQEATRLVDRLAAVTPALSPQLHAWPHQYSSVLIFGPARPMRWGRRGMALSDGIGQNIHPGPQVARFPTSI